MSQQQQFQRAMRQAVEHHQAGRLGQAEPFYREALRAEPRHPHALQLLGLLAYQTNRHPLAVEMLKKAITVAPRPEFYVNLSQAYRGMGDLKSCLDACRRAVQLGPDIPEAWNNLGTSLKEFHQPAEARQAFERAIQLRPNYVTALSNLGNTFGQLGMPAEAEATLRRAIEFDPGYAEAQSNLGYLLMKQGRLDEAVEWCHRAIQLRPDLGAAYTNLGTTLHLQGLMEEGDAVYHRAALLEPNNALLHENLLGAFNHGTRFTPEQSLEAHVAWARRFAETSGPPTAHANDRDPHRRLRIGYVSPDFRRHPVAHFLLPILLKHDRAGFEVFGYSNVEKPDDVTGQIRAACDAWREVRGMSDTDLAQRVREDRIDILIDLAGHTSDNRLLAFGRKPAPVQVTYLGYPNTTGLSTMDYRITDAVCDPEGESVRHTETLIRLPSGFSCYAPLTDAPPVAPLPATGNGIVTFGSLHKISRLNEAVIELWAELLRRTPASRLLLLRADLRGGTRERLRQGFLRRGVDDSRLELTAELPAGGHLAAYHRIDISLDTFPWSGHTTACESLWMGVPVVTLYGDRHAGRMVASVLTQLGLTECIADAPQRYLEIGSALAADIPRLATLRATLRERMQHSPLMDAAAVTRGYELALRDAWRRYCQS